MRLILMRHAKSDWSGDQDDHARPLNARGQRASAALGDWLSDTQQWPARALISSAARTQETWDRLSAPDPIDTRIVPALYLASPGEILAILQDAPPGDTLILGHNPGIGGLARWLARTPAPHPDFDRYPTGATTVLEVALMQWADIQPGTGRITDFVTPRTLHS